MRKQDPILNSEFIAGEIYKRVDIDGNVLLVNAETGGLLTCVDSPVLISIYNGGQTW